MYNRYIPQSDGSYRRNRVPEPKSSTPQRQFATPDKNRESHSARPCPPPPPAHEPGHSPQQELPSAPKPSAKQPRQEPDGITSFFKQLLPKDLDTADLLIILLLLLMTGDCEEDRNNALLTLALYFFM